MIKTTPCVKIPCGFTAGFFISEKLGKGEENRKGE